MRTPNDRKFELGHFFYILPPKLVKGYLVIEQPEPYFRSSKWKLSLMNGKKIKYKTELSSVSEIKENKFLEAISRNKYVILKLNDFSLKTKQEINKLIEFFIDKAVEVVVIYENQYEGKKKNIFVNKCLSREATYLFKFLKAIFCPENKYIIRKLKNSGFFFNEIYLINRDNSNNILSFINYQDSLGKKITKSHELKQWIRFRAGAEVMFRAYKRRGSVGALNEFTKRELNAINETETKFLNIRKVQFTSKDKLIAYADCLKDKYVIRVPLSEKATSDTYNNIKVMEAAKNSLDDNSKVFIPIFKSQSRVLISRYQPSLEKFAIGEPLSKTPYSEVEHELVVKLFILLHPRSSLSTVTLGQSEFEELIDPKIKQLYEINQYGFTEIEFLSSFLRTHLIGKRISLGATHCDFSRSNIYVYPQGYSVIDWDEGWVNYIIAIDAISYLYSILSNVIYNDRVKSLIAITDFESLSVSQREFLKKIYRYSGFDISGHKALVALLVINLISHATSDLRRSELHGVLNRIIAK